MTKQKVAYTVEVNTSCVCEDDFGSECYELSIEDLNYVLGEWVKISGSKATDYVLIEGKGMTWQRLSGSAVVDFDNLYESLKFGNDFRITFTLNDDELTAVRYSHDEPMGATFKFSFSPQVEYVDGY
jgi:hypothetical protein